MIFAVHSPVGDRSSTGQPPSVKGVLVDPVMMPIPEVYDIPMSVRNKPIPTPLAVLIVPGII